mmetsp:Transcript_20308/g.60352  ORF Transcript_20308/g.60352 Transcript_20308/m.60352 type:complete len:208 (-) Transcript_20308:652-1275(-)|eukprot:351722-Chlamydomonas_euryale.AAC.1
MSSSLGTGQHVEQSWDGAACQAVLGRRNGQLPPGEHSTHVQVAEAGSTPHSSLLLGWFVVLGARLGGGTRTAAAAASRRSTLAGVPSPLRPRRRHLAVAAVEAGVRVQKPLGARVRRRARCGRRAAACALLRAGLARAQHARDADILHERVRLVEARDLAAAKEAADGRGKVRRQHACLVRRLLVHRHTAVHVGEHDAAKRGRQVAA